MSQTPQKPPTGGVPEGQPIFRRPAEPQASATPSGTVQSGQAVGGSAGGLAKGAAPTSSPSVAREIDVLIRAKYPILYVVTHEEERVERMLLAISREHNKQCKSWSVTRGLLPTGTDAQSRKSISEMTRDPLAVLDSIGEELENGIFILKDFHPYLQDTTIIRRLRELAAMLRDSPKTLVIVAPSLKMPCELEKDITVVEFGLPTFAEVTQKLDEMIAMVKSNPQIRIDLSPEDRERVLKACQGLTLNEIENVLAKTLISRRKLDGEDLKAIHEEKEQIIRKSGTLEYFSATEEFKNVGGLENLKDWLMKRSQAFTERARAFGCTPPKGILLLGVQGCGKSLVAKAVCSLWRVPLLRLDMGRIFSSLVGSSEENVRRAIRTAESVAPAILWVDEIEKAFAGLQSSGQSDGGVGSRVFGAFITWLQEKTSPVFVIATSNRIKDLPPELFRKGRFDDIFFVDLPLQQEREQIFTIHLKKKGRDPVAFDLGKLALATDGYSGSEIEEAISSAIYEAFFLNRDLDTELILKAVSDTNPLSKTMKEEIGDLRNWASERARPASARPQPSGGEFRTRRALEIG